MKENVARKKSRVAEIHDSLKRTMHIHTSNSSSHMMTMHVLRIHVLNITRYRGFNLFDPQFILLLVRYPNRLSYVENMR